MTPANAVQQRIRDLQKERGVNTYKLIYMSGIPGSTVKSILNGKSHNPGICTIASICSGFGITLKEFFDSELFQEMPADMD